MKQTTYKSRVTARMDRVDRMTPELRACVHDFGLSVVDSFVQCDVTKPKHIRHLVTRVLEEMRGQLGPNGLAMGSKQGHHPPEDN